MGTDGALNVDRVMGRDKEVCPTYPWDRVVPFRENNGWDALKFLRRPALRFITTIDMVVRRSLLRGKKRTKTRTETEKKTRIWFEEIETLLVSQYNDQRYFIFSITFLVSCFFDDILHF